MSLDGRKCLCFSMQYMRITTAMAQQGLASLCVCEWNIRAFGRKLRVEYLDTMISSHSCAAFKTVASSFSWIHLDISIVALCCAKALLHLPLPYCFTFHLSIIKPLLVTILYTSCHDVLLPTSLSCMLSDLLPKKGWAMHREN